MRFGGRLVRRLLIVFLLLASTVFAAARQDAGQPDQSRLKPAYRFARNGWIYIHLEGAPADIGYQHGYLLAPEIEDGLNTVKLKDVHRTQRDWNFYRATAQNVLWPHIDLEYQQELQGIAEGLKAHGSTLDLWDVVALNAMEEIPDYYIPWLNKQQRPANAPNLKAPGNCSAFVATGSWTKDHKPVIAHSNWTDIATGKRWTIIFDIVPTHGYHMLTDGFPGIIVSDDDFGINSAGLMVTETTITGFAGFDPNGKPEFVRARKALQYSSSIDRYVQIMLDGNNGGYANDWLLADNNTGEVARFEIGLKLHRVWRTKDGYYAGANYPSDPALTKAETNFNLKNMSSSPNARRKRWQQLMPANQGQIDVALGETFLADHWDTYEGREDRNLHGLCGHGESSATGDRVWNEPPYSPMGAVTAQAADSTMAKDMRLQARAGHPCGEDFIADEFLKEHPEFEWQRPILLDMKGNPWAEFKSSDKP
ncbi:MAG: C45 family autoproteolytic acyltransferase/hydrolase [Acidobacteriota bacterium]|nr:C45 family autoproteolytic acyltransferase/hydrolase [Acidobacteriota bacterium]